MDKFIYSTFKEYPENFENRVDAARAKGECVHEVLKWKKAVDYNFSTGKHKFKESGGKKSGGKRRTKNNT